ncbi:MAG: Cof-type HAD-IIB family hydrolase [Thermoplasmata archaeon]|nr:Cof-type HAD-IIB family hydrolase [Thermoplasmata archaeon]
MDRTILPPSGRVSPEARRALRQVRAMGLGTILVSGRTQTELARLARGFGPWDALVSENGAVVEAPCGSPPRIVGRAIAAAVRRRLVEFPSLHPELGSVVISVPRVERRPLVRAVAGLAVDLIPNVDRLMVVPAGLTKRSGLRGAMRLLGVPGKPYAAIGDAENDVELLEGAAISGAVANARRPARGAADYLCRRRFDRGVLEFVQGPVRDWVNASSPS